MNRTSPKVRVLPLLAALAAGLALSVTGSFPAGKKDAAAAAELPSSDDPWDIAEPHGPHRDVTFTVEEATWLALDVHPDGRQIVFSLLGDLYLLPADGGEARRITSGPAYDVQPRFSPDGAWIAFSSDRDGLENLWICDLEGKQLRQISKEKKSTVSGPAWTPDGDYLVGRKRLTDMSSLGTVELWMFHLKGGDGFQLTAKDEQPDAADPAFSPDGRFLYYSARDSRYRYNRDFAEGIWQIKRFDRHTGQTLQLTSESGGAACPAPSPDGRSLAYVRRDRTDTRIEILDLAIGTARLLASGVTHDNQEGFAFHGVFPGYAWTPDGKAIVATAGGRIWRWDAGSGERTAIPFRADVEQRVVDALRTPQDPAPETVRARILRWPVESPDGTRLVFSAVGRLYTMALPDGPPEPLTGGDPPEYAPAFSPDGRRIAYVTWDDDEGGHVWTLEVGAAGAAPRRLTEHPGQYANPSFSPDGSRVVYVRGSGVTFRDRDLNQEMWHEIRWVEAGGGPSHYVIGTENRGSNRRMTQPAFSADGRRIFYVEDEPAGKPATQAKTVLVSVQLDGTDRRVHLRWGKGEEARVSPDGKWVVYSESHNAYVTALPEIGGKTQDVSASGPLPVAQLTDEGGEWVNWVDGGKTITWIFGSTYHRLPLEKAFPPPEPGDEEKKSGEGAKKDRKKGKKDDSEEEEEKKSKLPESQAVEIVLELPRARPSGVVAYTGARVITMEGDEVLEDGVLIVDGDRLTAVGAAGDVTVPQGARVVDLSGRTVIPGLFDEHAHLHYSTLDILPQRPWKYLANLAYGVTSTHDPSASTHEVFGQREMVEAGRMVGPRIFSTGFILYGADIAGNAEVNSLDDARHHVRRMKSLGAFSVKSYMQPKREQRQWILQAAREEGMLVVPEGGGDLEMDMTMVLDGHTTIEHSLPITPLYADVATLFGRSGTAYTPTLLVAYGGLSGDTWYFQHNNLWEDETLVRYVPQRILDGVRRRTMAPDDDWHHIDVAAGAEAIREAGGLVCMGAHGQMQGIGPHWEMWSFVQGGMSPMDALRTATINPAVALGLDAHLGSLRGGKLADFVVLERDPLEEIQHSNSVVLVVKNGVAYDPADLAR